MRQYEFYSAQTSVFSRIFLFLKKVLKFIGPTVAWATVSLLSGIFIGLAAVVLPPTAVFGVVALAAVILLWAIPELPYVPLAFSRKAFVAMIVVDLCVPAYYALSLPGLPWISARRLVIFAFVLSFAVIFGGAISIRQSIAKIIKENKLLFSCIVGYLAMAFLSIFTSVNVSTSIAVLVDAILLWFIPAIGAMLFLQSKPQILMALRVVCFCCLFVTLGGVVSFLIHKNVFLLVLPNWMINAMIANTPSFERMLTGGVSDRHGMYRSESIFAVSLSFAEFEAMILCIGYFFVSTVNTTKDRILGFVTILCVGLGIFASGARGGYMASIVGTVVFSFIMIVRALRFGGRSLAPGIALAVAILGFTIMFVAVVTVPAIHNRVLGGGADAYSDQARIEQWQLGIPKIQSNPITGHGFGMGGAVVGYHADTSRPTIDSYVLSVLVETGVPGLLFFVGIVGFGVMTGAKIAIFDNSPDGVMGGALASAIAAFGFYRIALSQVENFTLFFITVALVMNLNAQASKDPARSRRLIVW